MIVKNTNLPKFSRNEKTKVKTARGRKLSSTKWLERQLNDPYVKQSKKDGFRSRAAYKLLEINDKFKIFEQGQVVVDLGSTPGGWSQVARMEIGKQGRVIAIDINEMEAIEGVEFYCCDFLSDEVNKIKIEKVDVVLTDMAAPSCGHRATDHIRIMTLCESALYFALEHLIIGGHFVAKILQGGTEKELLDLLKKYFTEVKHYKPPASRQDSSEMYVIAKNFRGANI